MKIKHKEVRLILCLIITIILTLGLSVSFQSILAEWVEPISIPPEGNVEEPINKGVSGQSKLGGLILKTYNNGGYGLVVQYGNVGIGTLTPGEKLEVSGNIKASGAIIASGGKQIIKLPWFNASGASNGYIKLVTPIVHNEGNMFSIKINGYRYGNGGHPIEIRCGGYAYSATTLIKTDCHIEGDDVPVEIGTETRGLSTVVVIRIGTPTSSWYYDHFTAEYSGWIAKNPSDFQWVTAETTPTQTGNTNNVYVDDSAGTIITTGNVGIGMTGPAYKLDVSGDLRASGGGAFGGYAPSTTYKLTTPTLYAEQAQVGNPAGGLKGLGSINASSVCIEGVCQSSWPGVGGTSGWTDDGAVIRLTTITDNVGIGTAAPGGKLQINPPVSTEGLRIVTASDYSPFNIRNSTNVADIFRVDQSGILQVGNVPWARLTSFPTACTAGQYVTGIGSSLTCASAGGGTVTGVTATAPVVSSGGTAPVISMVAATAAVNGYMTSAYASKLDGIAAGATVGISQAAADTRYVNVGGDTMTGSLAINGIELNHNINNLFYINSYDGLQLRINKDGAGTGEFKINNSLNSPVFTVKDNGDVVIGGTGKLTVTTIDPVFNINGKKYSTYAPDYAGGTRIEVSGVIQLNSFHKHIIDFDNLEKGSNLWLFWQASSKDFETMSVLLTSSFKGDAWYEKDLNILAIHGSKQGEVSYRLSAPRIDYEKWSNITEDQNTVEGINVSDY